MQSGTNLDAAFRLERELVLRPYSSRQIRSIILRQVVVHDASQHQTTLAEIKASRVLGLRVLPICRPSVRLAPHSLVQHILVEILRPREFPLGLTETAS